MKIKNLLAFFLILTLLASVNILPKEKFVPEHFKKYINKSLKEWNVPGIAVGIMNKGYIILGSGFGFRDLEKKLPVTRYTLFPIGSSTKAFTSYITGKLVDENVLGWDDPVIKHLKGFELYDPWVTSNFRVSDLLIHNSGLPRHDLTWYRSDNSREGLFNGLKYLKNNKGFRTTFQYQNLMYMTAGYLSGQVKGTTWENLVKKYIFSPLEMDGANFSVEESEKSGNYALPYAENEGKLIKIPFYREMQGIGPAGSINSNVYEMLKWVKLHIDKGKWEGNQLISEENLKVTHTPQFVVGDTMISELTHYEELSFPTYGMGWFIQGYRGNTMIHHGGNIDGFSALVSFMPDIEAGIVILTNKNSNLLTLATALHIYDKLRGKKPIDWNSRLREAQKNKIKEMAAEAAEAKKKRKTGEGPHAPADNLVGVYNHGAYGDVIVSQNDGKLKIKFHKFESALKHIGGDDFELEGSVVGGVPIKFLKDIEGNITGLSAPLEPKVADIIFTKK